MRGDVDNAVAFAGDPRLEPGQTLDCVPKGNAVRVADGEQELAVGARRDADARDAFYATEMALEARDRRKTPNGSSANGNRSISGTSA